jgi:hypothetical protein
LILKRSFLNEFHFRFFPKDLFRELDENRGLSRLKGHLDKDASNKLLKEIYKLGSNKRKDSDTILKEAKNALRNKEIKETWVPSICSRYFPRYASFFRAPKVQFIYEHLFFVLFLMLFSYTLLCKLSYHEVVAEESNATLTDLSELDTKSVQKSIGTPVWQEYLLCFWILGMIFEEFLQVLNLDCALLLQAEFSKSELFLVYGLEEDARQLFGQPLELHRPDRLGVFRDRNVAKVHLDVHQ